MARIRSIKPSFFTDAKICRLSVHARLLFIATWTIADDSDGVFDARLSILRSAAFIEDPVTNDQIATWFAELVTLGLVWLFEDQGVPYGVVRSWCKHQVITKPAKKSNPNPPPEPAPGIPRNSPEFPRNAQECPEKNREEGKGREGKGGEVEEEAPGKFRAPSEQPPPPASQVLLEQRPAAAPAAPTPTSTPPLVLKLAQVARDTIIPRGAAPAVPDAGEVEAWQQLLAREPADTWESWWVPRLCELMRFIRASEKHGPGGSFVIAGPRALLKRSSPKDPHATALILDEMLGKFPTKLETPEKRARKARAAWIQERANELATAEMARRGSTKWSSKDEVDVKEQAEIEWEQRNSKAAVAA